MAEREVQRKQAMELYRELPKDAQMYFQALMNLAVILYKSTKCSDTKKGK